MIDDCREQVSTEADCLCQQEVAHLSPSGLLLQILDLGAPPATASCHRHPHPPKPINP